jgi:hypothetical protein
LPPVTPVASEIQTPAVVEPLVTKTTESSVTQQNVPAAAPSSEVPVQQEKNSENIPVAEVQEQVTVPKEVPASIPPISSWKPLAPAMPVGSGDLIGESEAEMQAHAKNEIMPQHGDSSLSTESTPTQVSNLITETNLITPEKVTSEPQKEVQV